MIALTDHDHWGTPFLDQHPEMWDEIRRQVQRFHAPGRFVTLLGYEWTSWIDGHRHVPSFGDEGTLLSPLDPAVESRRQPWAALRGPPPVPVPCLPAPRATGRDATWLKAANGWET